MIDISKYDLEKFDDTLANNIDELIENAIHEQYYKDEFIILQRIICIQYEKIKELEGELNVKTRTWSSRDGL